jgi:hypothetical protein
MLNLELKSVLLTYFEHDDFRAKKETSPLAYAWFNSGGDAKHGARVRIT